MLFAMKRSSAPYETHLLRLRLWREQVSAGGYEWRGQVTHSQTGAVRSFRTWEQLVTELRSLLEDEPRTGVQDNDR